MHERYGLWTSAYVRFQRWAEQGVWDATLATLVKLGLTDDWQHIINSTTTVRGHVSTVDGKGARRLLVDHAAALTIGRPLGFILTGGEASHPQMPPRFVNTAQSSEATGVVPHPPLMQPAP